MKYKIKSQLSEKQIEADVATYFGWITPQSSTSPFRLLDINEQVTGADKMYDRVVPIYMQFKVSHGLSKISRVSSLIAINTVNPLQRIRLLRSRIGLFDDPSLYFQLRAKANNAEDFQHNILLNLTMHGSCYAFYVAPLTLSKNDYSQMLFDASSRNLYDPYYYDNIIEIHQNKWITYLGFVPFLRAHISIVPHERVSTEKHYYSFSQNGTDIAWHSETYFSKSVSRLSDMLIKIFSTTLNNPKNAIPIKDYVQTLEDRNIPDILDKKMDIDDDFPLYNLMQFGQQLYHKYDIRQFLLLLNTEMMNKINNHR